MQVAEADQQGEAAAPEQEEEAARWSFGSEEQRPVCRWLPGRGRDVIGGAAGDTGAAAIRAQAHMT